MIRFKLELIPQDGIVRPYTEPYGYIFRALLMNWLKELKPKLVHELHTYNKIRPYSIQVLYQKTKLVFFLNIFDSQISTLLINDLINRKNKVFEINNQDFILRKVVFKEVSLQKMVKKTRPIKNFKIRFLEPTYFNTARADNVIRLPIPELLFNNLLNLWNEFYNGKEHIEKEDYINWINRNIFISSFKIKTQAKEMGEKIPAAGVIGWVVFEIKNSHSNYAKFIDCLCKLGELTNLGGNRTAGLGVIKYTPLVYSN